MFDKDTIKSVIDLCQKGWQHEQDEYVICAAIHKLLPGAKPMGPYRYTQNMDTAMMLLPTLPDGRRVSFEICEDELGKHTARVKGHEATANYAAFALVMASLKASAA